MDDDLKNYVETLIQKAASADESGDAMRFSQAACNAANAICALRAVIELKPLAEK